MVQPRKILNVTNTPFEGISFHIDNKYLDSTKDILAANAPIGILVDGETVRDVPGPKGLPLLGSQATINAFSNFMGHCSRQQS